MKVKCLLLFLLGTVFFSALNAQPYRAYLDSLAGRIDSLRMELKKLKEKEQQNELEKIREAALQSLQTQQKQKEKLEEKTFREGSRSLQALNPEISLTGDMLGRYLTQPPHYTDEVRSGFTFRVLEVAAQSNLDPFSLARAILEFSPEEIGLGEAYITWANALPRINLTAGKFRQQFGVVNRWHQHALDQSNYPLPIELYMGEEGLNQVGLSLSWLMPSLLAQANELTFQLTNAENPLLFSGADFSLPAGLLHFKNYYDLNQNTYLEWGVSSITGTCDSLGFTLSHQHRWTTMAGFDLSLSWSPVNRALYRGIIWRSELFYVNKESDFPERLQALGGYTYLDYRFNQQLIGGFRAEIAQPLQYQNAGKYLYRLMPYITFWQSEFVFFRFEFSHLEGRHIEGKDNRIIVQLNWSVGPHKHERY